MRPEVDFGKEPLIPDNIEFQSEASRQQAFPICKKDLANHGASPNCPGCRQLLRGTRVGKHSSESKVRFEAILRKAKDRRIVSYDERVLRKAERDIENLEEANEKSEADAPHSVKHDHKDAPPEQEFGESTLQT